jgi:hypothetical protein
MICIMDSLYMQKQIRDSLCIKDSLVHYVRDSLHIKKQTKQKQTAIQSILCLFCIYVYAYYNYMVSLLLLDM